MRLRIDTTVKNHFLKVKEAFTEDLFLALNPPFPLVNLRRFDGCKKGDLVDIELDFILFKQYWISEIIDDQLDENAFVFIDIGKKLPFFLSSWRHEHSLKNVNEEETVIRDDITFSGAWFIPSFLLYPVLYLQFLYRKPVYKKMLSSKGG